MKEELRSYEEGDVRLWLEQQASIHLKASDSYGDPVELTATSAREIAAGLTALADMLDTMDGPRRSTEKTSSEQD